MPVTRGGVIIKLTSLSPPSTIWQAVSLLPALHDDLKKIPKINRPQFGGHKKKVQQDHKVTPC